MVYLRHKRDDRIMHHVRAITMTRRYTKMKCADH